MIICKSITILNKSLFSRILCILPLIRCNVDRMKFLKEPLPINGYEAVSLRINKVIGKKLQSKAWPIGHDQFKSFIIIEPIIVEPIHIQLFNVFEVLAPFRQIFIVSGISTNNLCYWSVALSFLFETCLVVGGRWLENVIKYQLNFDWWLLVCLTVHSWQSNHKLFSWPMFFSDLLYSTLNADALK